MESVVDLLFIPMIVAWLVQFIWHPPRIVLHCLIAASVVFLVGWIGWKLWPERPDVALGGMLIGWGVVLWYPMFAPAPNIVSVDSTRISMLSLMTEAQRRGWVFLGSRDALYDFCHGLRQAALDEQIMISGVDLKKGRDPKSAPSIYPLVRVPASYFKDHSIELHQAMMHGENAYAMTDRPGALGREDCYSALAADRHGAMAWLAGPGEGIRSRLRVPSKLMVQVGEDGSLFETRSGGLYRTIRTYFLDVSNQAPESTIADIVVTLVGIEPPEYKGPWTIERGFSLSAGEHHLVPLVSYGEPFSGNHPTSNISGDSFAEVLANKSRPKLDWGKVHTLVLRITGNNSAPCDFSCRVWVDRQGSVRLRIEAASR